MYPRSSKVGTPRVDHQETIQELIDLAIMTDRTKRGDFAAGLSVADVHEIVDAAFLANPGISEIEVQALIDAYAATNLKPSFRGEWSGLSVISTQNFMSGFGTMTNSGFTIGANPGGVGAPPSGLVASTPTHVHPALLEWIVPDGISMLRFYWKRDGEVVYGLGGLRVGGIDIDAPAAAWGWTHRETAVTAGQVLSWWSNDDYNQSNMQLGLIELLGATNPYAIGDSVTYAGSFYVCGVASTGSTPGTNGDWTRLLTTPPAMSQTFTKTGVLVPEVGTAKWVNTSGRTLAINPVVVSVSVAPTTALIADVTKNGVSIFTNQANRPTIAVGALTGVSGVPDLAWAANEYLTADIDQVVGASNLTMQVSAK